MGQTSGKIDDESKILIKIAIWHTYEQLSGPRLSSSEYVDSLFHNIKYVFPREECNKWPFINGYSPDIVVKGRVVIEVKSFSEGFHEDQIQCYMNALSLPGAQIYFLRGFPKVYWFELDSSGVAHMENVGGEILSSDPSLVAAVRSSTGVNIGMSFGDLMFTSKGVHVKNVRANVNVRNETKPHTKSEFRRNGSNQRTSFNASKGDHETERNSNLPRNYKPNTDSDQHTYDEEVTRNEFMPERDSRATTKYTFDKIYNIVLEATAKAKLKFGLGQYTSEFCTILNQKLYNSGVPFEKSKEFIFEGRKIYPDVYIHGVAVIEINYNDELDSRDEQEMKNYMAATGLNGILVNFDSDGEPHARIFQVQ